MGGAPSLVQDAESLGDISRFVTISANEHGAKLLGKVDYCVFGDEIHQEKKVHMVEYLREWHDGPLVTQKYLPGTVRLHDYGGMLLAPNSGYQAVWWAWLLGLCPIYLAGFGLYQSGTYWHDPEARSTGLLRTRSDHVARYRHLHHRIIPWTVRALSGPLQQVTGKPHLGERVWEPDERQRRWWNPEWRMFHVKRTEKFHGQTVEKGQALWLTWEESRQGVRNNWLELVTDQPVPPPSHALWEQQKRLAGWGSCPRSSA